MRSPGPSLAVATAALLCLIWGTTWAAIRIGLEGIPPLTGVALRFGLAALVLLPLGMLLGIRFGAGRVERRLWLVHTVFSFCISYGIVYWAEQWVPSGLASVLFATFPLFVALLAHFALPGEGLSPGAILGVVIGFAGVAVIFSEDFSLLGGAEVARASAIMLLSPLAAAVGNVAVKRWGRDVHSVSLNGVAMLLTAGVMGVLALICEGDRPLVFDRASVGALVYLAVVGSAVTFSLYFWLLLHVPATRLAMVGYVIPVVAVAVGALVLHEPVTARTAVGAVLVLAGVAVAVRARPLPP